VSGLGFATPALLALLPLLAALLAWRWWRRPAATPALLAIDLAPIAAAAGRGGWRVRRRWLPGALRVLALTLVVLALARPQRGLAIASLPEEGVDIVLALDISGSMSERTQPGTRGGGPTRLEAAREVIADFTDTLEGDRVGLVVFQSRALVLSPLTLDHVALRRTVRNVESGLLPDGTAVGLGLADALNVLRESNARSRVVVLLTDGANNSGEISPAQAAQLAKALGIRVYTIGFVSNRPGAGADVDETTLRRIAAETQATYYDATTEQELQQAYEAIGALERSRVAERQFTSYREFGPWLALAAGALLLAEAVLRATTWRRHP
jgi:Ca-activated chloride channel family protein